MSYRCTCGFLKNKTLDAGQLCPRCHVMCIDNISRLKILGKIKLISPIIKPTRKNEIIKIIGKKNKQLLDPKQADANAALNRFIGVSKDKKELVMVTNSDDIPDNFILIPFQINGLYSLIYILRFLADIIKVESIQKLFQNEYIIDEIDVLPPDIRPVFKDPNNPNVLRYEEINKFYISLLNSNKRNQLFYPTMMDELKFWTTQLVEKIRNGDNAILSDLSIVTYDQISAFYQFYVDEIYHWCFEHIKGKKGLIRSTILSRTLEFSGRTVVTVDPNCRPYEIKVPREMLFTLWFPYFVNYLVKNKGMRYDETYYRIAEKKYFEIREDREIHRYFIEFLDWFSNSDEAKIIEYEE